MKMTALFELNMNNFNSNRHNILDLPDEILLFVLKKLDVIDVLYSLVNVNRRFDRLALDFLCIRDLDITNTMMINSLCHGISLDTPFLSKIREKILPRIHNQVQKLTVEQHSMKDILGAASYPQLYSLSLINFEEEILGEYLTSKYPF
jgi:hypothetical protein